jgi:hypothetical protein
MTFLPSSCSLPLSLLKPAPPLMAVIRHCPHVDTSFHAIHKNYLWSLSAIRVTATFPYLLMQHVTPSLSLFHGNVLRILTDLPSFFLFPSTDILPSLSVPTSLHLLTLNTTHCAPPTTPPPAKPEWIPAGPTYPLLPAL